MVDVLVVGASGLIGGRVLAEARRAGASADAVVARARADQPDARVLRLEPEAVEPLTRLIEGLRPQVIVNCAGRTEGKATSLWRANVEPVAVIVEAIRRARSTVRLVHIGSAAVYAPTPDRRPTPEAAPTAPRSAYGASKLAAAEHVAAAVAEGLDAVEARVFNPIGAGLPASSLPGRAARMLWDAIQAGRRSIELGPLGATRDYVDLRDISTAVLLLARAPHLEHAVYNLGTGRPVVVRDLVAMIADRLGFEGVIRETAAGSPRSPTVDYQVADVTRLRAVGWRPVVELTASVSALVDGMRADLPTSPTPDPPIVTS